MKEQTAKKIKPDIRAITRLVPPEGNLVQGQSELLIDPQLAKEAATIIAASQNHYGGSEGDQNLRRAVAEKIKKYNGIEIDVDAKPLELMITNGGTGALIGIAQSYLRNNSALVFEPYYPYHRRILEEFGSKTETFELDENLTFEKDALLEKCREIKDRSEFPLKAVIVCTPANPSGKVMTQTELEAIAEVCQELDLLCISDEVYEHYVTGENPHIPIASLPNMWERTITVNSFSKSWNISGWRLGYAYGMGELIAPINNAANVIYVCPSTPLQAALSRVLMADENYYNRLRDTFDGKRRFAAEALTDLGFQIYDSGSAFYLWTRIPEEFSDALKFNEMLMERAGVAAVPGSAFADSDDWDSYMRICIAREDSILEGALEKIQNGFAITFPMAEKRRIVWRKLAKWFGVFMLCVAASIGAVYVYLASQTGEKAIEREVFKQKNSRPLVFAHRGGGGLIPENTLEAFVYSARMGVDVLELDIHSTSDGTLVVMHDAAVDRTTDGRGRVNELTLEAVKKLDAGYLFSSDGGQTFPFRGKGISVPTLREIFDALPEMTFNIEPKQHTPSITTPLCVLLRERKMIDKVVVGSFNQTTIDNFRRECSEVATSASPSEVSRFLALVKAGLGDSYSPPMQALQVPRNLGGLQVVSKEFIETAHRRNLKVHVWTINETSEMQRLLEMGVDGIMTDYPDRLLTLLGRR